MRLARRLLAAAFALAVLVPAGAVETDPGEALASDPDVSAAKAAHDRRDWKEAVARLHGAEKRFPDNADLQNSLGYAYRNLKQFEAAFRHYGRALKLDPRHRGAHEYIGEAYLMVNDVASAEKHVAALRGICLLGCEELRELQQAVADYKLKAPGR
jgi:Flp pilus assembly protein TadD